MFNVGDVVGLKDSPLTYEITGLSKNRRKVQIKHIGTGNRFSDRFYAIHHFHLVRPAKPRSLKEFKAWL